MKATVFWKELAPALFFLCFGIAVYWETTRMSDSFSIGVGMDARTYPRILAFICIGLSILLLIKAVIDGLSSATTGEEQAFEQRPDFVKLLLSLASFAVYAFFLHDLGFVIATALLIAASLLIAGERRYLPIILFSVVSAGAVQVLVRLAFSIVLPEGPFAAG